MKVDKLSVNKYSEKILDDLVNKSEQYSIVVEQNNISSQSLAPELTILLLL